uniref:phosphatidylinositol-3,5-bisphosphate 3-phosphatase n=1 Tax=Heterorhabditis bacteriophora TaxID=37862 RepID=A0A1I7XJE2_HETBA
MNIGSGGQGTASRSSRCGTEHIGYDPRDYLAHNLPFGQGCQGVMGRILDNSILFKIANGLIGSVERGTLTAAGCPLIIRCKHFQVINLLINRDKACQDLYETLLRCSKPVNVSELLAFENRDVAEDARGWSRLDWGIEFSRQGVNYEWVEMDINQNYKVVVTHIQIVCGCLFLPIERLLWGVVDLGLVDVYRCAQPLTGFSARCVEDEKLMELIGKANKNSETLYLVDTRPRVNAMVNKVQGKGFEDEKNYSNMRFYFFDIENIHVMRASQQKMLEVYAYITQYYFNCHFHLGISCVVHCSDGWDRTSQTVAIAQLLLDPFYRTIHGFQVLIEKDWLGFGHKFDDRCAHIGALNDEAAKEVSPIFSQFLDCVFQITRQRPRAFQFNDRYLIDIHEHAYSCQFGTFIGNCDKDRKDLNLSKRTKSLWTFLDSRQDDYLNPFYEPTTFGLLTDLDTRASSFVVWHAVYNRFDNGLLPREMLADTVMASMEHVGVLESHVAALRMRIAELKKQLGKNSVSMIDSGHSSSNGHLEEKQLPERPPSQESGVYDQSLSYSEEALTCQPLRWQSLRDASRCTLISCGAEFVSVIDRRIHCHRCGKIFCRRCVRVTADERERICEACRSV